MRKSHIFLFVIVLSVPGYSTTFTVDDDGPADFVTIQAAIKAAVNGDVIVVENGTYTGEENRNIDFLQKTITLKSKNGPTHCTIDCQSAADCFAFLIQSCDPVIEGFTIVRCSTMNTAEAISIWASNCVIKNCIFTDNAACIYCWGANGTVANCTFYGNTAGPDGGAVGMSTNSHLPATFAIRNSILWANEPNDIDLDYCQCKSGVHPGMFVEFSMLESNWQNKTRLTFENCIYGQAPNFADPNNGDFHLQSQAGRWDPATENWVVDVITSPAIDAGDSSDAIGYEPFPNGGIVNMGAYGGTDESSKSYFGTPPCAMIMAGDINGDCAINLLDFEFIARHWLMDYNP